MITCKRDLSHTNSMTERKSINQNFNKSVTINPFLSFLLTYRLDVSELSLKLFQNTYVFISGILSSL